MNEIRKVSDELDLYVKQNADEVKAKLLQEDEESKAILNYNGERLDLERKKMERLMMMGRSSAGKENPEKDGKC